MSILEQISEKVHLCGFKELNGYIFTAQKSVHKDFKYKDKKGKTVKGSYYIAVVYDALTGIELKRQGTFTSIDSALDCFKYGMFILHKTAIDKSNNINFGSNDGVTLTLGTDNCKMQYSTKNPLVLMDTIKRFKFVTFEGVGLISTKGLTSTTTGILVTQIPNFDPIEKYESGRSHYVEIWSNEKCKYVKYKFMSSHERNEFIKSL